MSIDDFVGKGEAYSIVKEADRLTGEYAFKLQVQNIPPVVYWSLLVGDCFHNIRTALDHLFWGLVLREHPDGLKENTSALNFPILKDAGTFNGRKVRLERWVGHDVTKKLEEIQPFNDERGWNKNPLMFLHDFNNIDKHRLLLPAISVLNSGQIHTETVDNRNVTLNGFATLLQFEDGAEIARFQVQPPEDLVDMDYRVSFDVIFEGQPGPLRVIPSLERTIEVVEEVISEFEPLL